MGTLAEIVDNHLKNLTKWQSFILLMLIVLGSQITPILKNDTNKQILIAIKEQNQLIRSNQLDAVSKKGAEYLYKKTFNDSKYQIYYELENIIEENNIQNSYRQIEIKDRMYQRIQILYRNDYAALSEFRYNGIPLSYALKEIKPNDVTDKICDYIFKNTDKDKHILLKDIRIQLDNIFNRFRIDAVSNLNEL